VKRHILININLVFMSAQIGYTKINRKMQYRNDTCILITLQYVIREK